MKPGASPMKRTSFVRAARIEAREVAKIVIKEKKLRTRKCAIKACLKEFAPRSMTHKTCGPECAQEYVRVEKARTDRRERQEGLAKLRTKRDYVKTLQVAFNAYIRARDARLPCICCGRTSEKQYLTGTNWDCGHYRSTGSAPHLRFNEDNAHRQLTICNRHGAGRAVDYRIGLIARIGLARVEALEADNEARHYTVDQLIAMTAHYRKLLKDLKASAGPDA
jgi:hypothetical protein